MNPDESNIHDKNIKDIINQQKKKLLDARINLTKFDWKDDSDDETNEKCKGGMVLCQNKNFK